VATPLRALILEDRRSDAELVLYELRRAGFAPAPILVETEQDYIANLTPELDVILADYSLPQFDAVRALEILQDRKLSIPFIIVSANMGEDIAVSAMRRGASDYLLKDRLARLGQAVTHAMAYKELQASLRRSETMSILGSLVSGVAHEVRNPLFGISSTLDAFEAYFGAKPEYQRYLEVLRREVDRLRSLMKDLLDYGRPINQEFSPGSIRDVIAQAIHACEPLAKRSEVNVINQARDSIPQIQMDSKRLLQVFLNLCENAIQHSPQGGSVVIQTDESWQTNQGSVLCVVRDNGPGVKKEDLPHLFEPFFTRRRGGTGLGLSIVQRIVEAHGGTIDVRNHPEGGAEVTVKFPVVDCASPSGHKTIGHAALTN
jgi:signal transduction histidine kinase